MANDRKPPNAIPSKAFPTAPTQEERARQGTPPPKPSPQPRKPG
jgi:hypothetical protein